MKLVLLAALAISCGGPRTRSVVGTGDGPPPPPVPQVVRDYPATQWIPAKPTYAFAARTVTDAQHALIDAIDTAGIALDVDARLVSVGLAFLIGVDPLSADALAGVGVDVNGGVAVFSDAVEPTVVMHLAAPDQTAAFLAKLPKSNKVSWAIDKDWLWLHIGSAPVQPAKPSGTPIWIADWEWAQKHGATPVPPVVGFVDFKGLAAAFSTRLPEAIACAELVRPVGHAGFVFEGDGKRVGIRVALDVDGAAPGVAAALLPAPEGWDAVAGKAPLAVQWNLDLESARAAIAPCVRTFGVDLARLDTFGVRAGRVILQTFDPKEKSGTGAIALDITSKKLFASWLDEIPLRSTMESSRNYGPYAGKRLSIPFGPKLDYVLTDKLALAGVGDGLLLRVVGKGPSTQPGPIFAVDITPAGLSPQAWEFLLRTAQIPAAKQIATRMQSWNDAHVAIRLDGTRIVFEAMGNRR